MKVLVLNQGNQIQSITYPLGFFANSFELLDDFPAQKLMNKKNMHYTFQSFEELNQHHRDENVTLFWVAFFHAVF